jgi:glutaredoxin 3
MAKIEIYTKAYCPFCRRAKALLDTKGVPYQEYEVSTDQALQQQMRERSGRTTVPQVFIDDQHIGGSDDLAAAQNDGSLDHLLGFQQSA